MHCSLYSLGPLAGGGRVSEASNRDVVESGDIERVRVRVWINEPPHRIFGLEKLEALVAAVTLGDVVAHGKREGLTALVELVGCRLGHLVAVESYMANAKVEAREEGLRDSLQGDQLV